MVELYHSSIRGRVKVLLLIISLLIQSFDPALTETCTCLFLYFCRFKYFLESHSCSAEGYMAFKSIWRAMQQCIVALSEIMEKKNGDRLEEIT